MRRLENEDEYCLTIHQLMSRNFGGRSLYFEIIKIEKDKNDKLKLLAFFLNTNKLSKDG